MDTLTSLPPEAKAIVNRIIDEASVPTDDGVAIDVNVLVDRLAALKARSDAAAVRRSGGQLGDMGDAFEDIDWEKVGTQVLSTAVNVVPTVAQQLLNAHQNGATSGMDLNALVAALAHGGAGAGGATAPGGGIAPSSVAANAVAARPAAADRSWVAWAVGGVVATAAIVGTVVVMTRGGGGGGGRRGRR